jgi:Ferric reductase like transmembrane component
VTALANVGPSALWYLTRATGAVSLVLLTVSVVLGIAVVGRLATPAWPRFVVNGLHRNVSLLAITLLAVHVVTSVLDPFAGIRLVDAVVPFVSSYRPLWLGLGALAADLLIAITLTSVIRRRLGHRAWRATHWMAYACWPVAVLHTVGTGSDVKQAWLLALTAACVAAVIGAVWVRIGAGWPDRRRLRIGAAAASVALPIGLVLWLPGGPLAANWARRAGTPLADLQPVSATVVDRSRSARGASQPVSRLVARVHGTLTEHGTTGGLVSVDVALRAASNSIGAVDVRIVGEPLAGGGVQMSSGSVTAGPASEPASYRGAIDALQGTRVGARVSSQAGRTLDLELTLSITPGTNSVDGTLEVTPA